MDGRRLRGFGHGGGARRARRPFLGGGCVLFGLWGRDEVKVLVGGGWRTLRVEGHVQLLVVLTDMWFRSGLVEFELLPSEERPGFPVFLLRMAKLMFKLSER